MPPAPLPLDEVARLASLHALDILDTPPDAEFDALARAASLVFDAPIALLTLVDANRQWFKANVGLPDTAETPREMAFCGHAILGEDLLEVPNAALDARFSDNALVTGRPEIRFYAGMPVRLGDGSRVGTLCVIDRVPRVIDDRQRDILRCLGRAAGIALDNWHARRLREQAIIDLRLNEDRIRTRYDVTPAMLHSAAMDGEIVAVSDAWLKKLGYSRDAVIGRKAIDFLSAKSRAFAQAEVLPALVATGHCEDVAYEMVRGDGEIIDVLFSARLERDADGRPLRSFAAIEDVTLRRRAERALSEERRRLANIIEATRIGTWEWNVQTGELRLNGRWAEILGRTLDEMAPISIRTRLDLVHPDDLPRSKALLERHFADESDFYEMESRMRHRDGRYVWVLSRGKLMTRTADGRPEWMYGKINDITDRKQQEHALRKSEEFLERTGRAAGVGGWEIDLATDELDWSAETCRIHGVPPDFEPTIEKVIALYAPEARPVLRDLVKRAKAAGGPWDLELPLDPVDGGRRWVRVVGSAVFVDGKPARMSGALQDVTDLVAKREALRIAHERIAIATDSGGIGIWDWNLATDSTVWDSWMYRLYGIAPSDHIGINRFWADHVHPDDLAGARQSLRDALAGRTPLDTEFRVVWPDGSIHHHRASGRVTRDARGRAIRMVGASWDVTEQRLLAAALVEHAERAAEAAECEMALFRNSPDFHYIVRVTDTDADGAPGFVFETVSPAAERIIGSKSEDLAGRRPEQCFPPETAAIVRERFRHCLATATTVAYAQTHVVPLGKRDYEGSITPVRHPSTGRIVRLAGTLRDVTERNLMQEALHHSQKMNAIGRLASGVAHDFNNILQSISGSLELVLDDAPPGTQEHDFLSIGLRAAKRGSYLTFHLLSYARKQLLRARNVDVRSMLSDIEILLFRTLNPRVLVRMRCDDAVTSVHVDAGQLQTALLNLAINASHAMPDGGTLTIEARPVVEDARNWMLIAVTDTGTGMDDVTLAQALEPFFTTKGLEGTGLGLPMVQGFAEQSGGRFRIRSALGVGTTIELLLPPSASAPVSVDPTAPERRETTGCIVLVDDDADVLVTTASFLEKAGFVVMRANNANQALAVLAGDTRVDALVTDYAMPGMNGADLVAEARLRRPNLPAVLISGFIEIKDMPRIERDTMRLHKPFQRGALIDVLNELIGVAAVPRG